jgi:hypothetical protein
MLVENVVPSDTEINVVVDDRSDRVVVPIVVLE